MNKFIFKLKKKLPTILSIVAAGGVVATGYFSAKAQRKTDREKIERFEKGEEYPLVDKAKNYILPTVIGGVTIACIFGSNHLNKKEQSYLLGAYIATEQAYNKLRQKVEEKYGEEVVEDIRKEIEEELAENEYPTDELEWFYEPITGIKFHATVSQVLEAQLELNKKFHTDGEASLNDFLMFCYQPPIPEFDNYVWTYDNAYELGYSFIDCWHRKMDTDDGLECWELYFPWKPEEPLLAADISDRLMNHYRRKGLTVD